MNFVLLIYAALFLAGASVSLASGKFGEAGAAAAIALGLCGLGYYMRRQEQERLRFVDWLSENLDSVASGGQWYGDTRVTSETVLRQYEMAVSFLAATVRTESRYYISETGAGTMPALVLATVSLLLGWWGFPGGPFVTIQAVWVNLRGGKRLLVQDLNDGLTAHRKELVQLTERAADHARFLMRSRGFPDTTALQVEMVWQGSERAYSVTFDDQPPSDGSVWWSEAHGIKVLVPKRIAAEVDGLLIDAARGEFQFRQGPPRR
jgi:hypothetical protein